jgi:hypothetical protein
MKKGVLRVFGICNICFWAVLVFEACSFAHADEMIISDDANGLFYDEVSVDSGAAAETGTGSIGTDGDSASINVETTGAESKNVSAGDISGLFVDTGEVTMSTQGELLDDALTIDGLGDGGSTVAMGHLYEINGVLVRNSDFPSEHYECWTYANNVYAKIWGHNFWNLFNDTENMLRNLPDEALTLTPEHLKAYVSAAPAGAALRVCDEQYLHADDGWGHSQIIISHDENGFTVFEGGLAAYPHRREAYYTWDGFCFSGWPGKYHYIKYIKWPGAAPYSGTAAGENALDLGVAEDETQQEEASDPAQTETEEEGTPGMSLAEAGKEGAPGMSPAEAGEEGAPGLSQTETEEEGTSDQSQAEEQQGGMAENERMQGAWKDAVREWIDMISHMVHADEESENK